MDHGNVSPLIAQGLLELKARIAAAKIPSSKIDESINVATWNIREFGKKARSQAAIHYIAEVIAQFDLVSLVELGENLSDLKRVMDILGADWRVVYSGVIKDDGGNGERLGFIYDRRAVAFNGLAAVAVPPRQKVGNEYLLLDRFWWRLPYMASFRAGNFDFVIVAAHIRWADTNDNREPELDLLARWVEDFRQSETAIDRDILVVGDFNITSRRSRLFKTITQFGLQVPKALLADEFGSNLAKDKRYDQILQYASEVYPESFADVGGVLDFHLSNSAVKKLFPSALSRDLTLSKYTYQMSDHLPLWIQIRTDNAKARLEQLIRG